MSDKTFHGIIRMGSRQVFAPVLALAPERLRADLLIWWESHGRHTIPWKRGAGGPRPGPGEPLDPYPIWCAEVMRAAGQHSCSFEGSRLSGVLN
jgi:hypothetical protein